MRKLLSVIFAAGLLVPFAVQTGYSQVAGGSAVPFLIISPDSRASGMGEAGTGMADNINAVFWNPGGLGFQEKSEISSSYSRWLPQFNTDLFYLFLTGGTFVEAIDGMVAASIMYFNLGEFQRTDATGRVLGPFRSNDFAIGVSYGTLIADDIGAGVHLRYIQSNLAPGVGGLAGGAGVGRSSSVDLGLLWRPSKLFGEDMLDAAGMGRFGLGLNIQNIGPRITYANQPDPLPSQLRLGTSYKALEDEFNSITIAVDMAKLLVKRDSAGTDIIPQSFVTAWERGGVEWSFGAEYWYDKIVALRAGYFTEPVSAGNRQFITFGAGIRYEMFHLDFSFINTIEENHPLANTMRFTLNVVDIGKLLGKTK